MTTRRDSTEQSPASLPATPRSTSIPGLDGPFDLLVIGGGINGCGLARDAALRGMSVALLEMGDFGAATTGASSGMIHGGVRYLLYDPDTTRLACEDAGRIAHIASHLIFRIPFICPVLGHTRGKRRGVPLPLMEVFLRLYGRYSPLKGGKPSSRLSRDECLSLEPGLSEDITGAVTLDEWGVDAARLTLENALSAAEHGAVVRNGVAVRELLRGPDGGVIGALVRDSRSGASQEVRARCVVNATGPWSERTAALAGAKVRLRPAKGVHLVFERRITSVGLVFSGLDGRQLFLIPHERETWIGTTDDDYFGDPGDIPIHHDEVQYLLHSVEQVFPTIRSYRLVRAFAGIRPTLFAEGRYEDELSREHRIFDHASDGAPGLLSLAGGKLASYRIMGEETVDEVARHLGGQHYSECTSGQVLLAGAGELESSAELSREFNVSELAVRRLQRRHGSQTRQVLTPCLASPELAMVVCRCEPMLAAEIVWAVNHEMARDLSDVARRTRMGLGACQGVDCVLSAARVTGELLGWDFEQRREEARLFLTRRRRERTPVLGGVDLAAEELRRGALDCLAGL